MKRARIILQASGDGDGPVWHGDQRLSIGRMPSCDVVLDDASISRRHAEVMYTEGGWVVRDLGSTNGTRLNGARLGRVAQRLSTGDELQPGRVSLLVKSVEDDTAATPGLMQDTVFREPVAGASPAGMATAECALFAIHGAAPGADQSVHRSEPLTAGDPLREFLADSLRGVVEALGAQGGALYLWESTTRKLLLRSSCRPSKDRAAVYDGVLVQRCFQQGTAFLCADVESLGDETVVEASGRSAGLSVVCVPLRTGCRVQGVLCCERTAPQKPFSERDQLVAQSIAYTINAGIANAEQLLERQRLLYMQSMLALAQAVDSRDPYNTGHTQRVTAYALLLGEEMQVTAAEYHCLQVGTPLHDIGKINIDETLLRKPGRLTPAEFAEMKTHPAKGVALLQEIAELQPALPIIGSHHEHWDGSGYPDGLIGEIIPPLARVVTVADVFDALTSDRPYRKALTPAEAFNYLQRNAGTVFDPQCAQAFLRARAKVEKLLRDHAVSPTLNKREMDQLRTDLASSMGRSDAVPDARGR